MKSAGGGGAPCKTVIQKVRKSYLFTIRHAAQYAVIICGMECFLFFFPPEEPVKTLMPQPVDSSVLNVAAFKCMFISCINLCF